jgi:isopentenyl-diphosphate delta-isomerase
MTGGTEQAGRINQALAEAAESCGVAMGLGSQRAALEDRRWEASYQVRRFAPNLLLLANLGAVQLNYGYGVDECRRAVEMVGANALILHLNPLQEAVEPGGDSDFSDLLRKIGAVCRGLPVPVIAKEVGWGISAATARRLVEAGVAVIDVAGAGGTSWSQVAMHRAKSPEQAELAATFADWGIPTPVALQAVRRELPEIPLIASGGVRSGVDIAKGIALGADLGAMAGPFLKAAAESAQAVHSLIGLTMEQLRVAMFATGSRDLTALRRAELWSEA